MNNGRTVRAIALLVVGAVALTACGDKVKTTPESKASLAACGTVNLAVNPWVGYEADAAVVSYVLKNKLAATSSREAIDEKRPGRASATGRWT